MNAGFILLNMPLLYAAPGNDSIQALKDCTLLCIDYEEIYRTYKEFPVFNIFGRKNAEEYVFYQARMIV